jgi:hypothetical protein
MKYPNQDISRKRVNQEKSRKMILSLEKTMISPEKRRHKP